MLQIMFVFTRVPDVPTIFTPTPNEYRFVNIFKAYVGLYHIPQLHYVQFGSIFTISSLTFGELSAINFVTHLLSTELFI